MKTLTIFSILFFVFISKTFGQKGELELTFTAKYQSEFLILDSILIENLTQGGEMLITDTVLFLTYITGFPENNVINTNDLRISQNIPNPFNSQTKIVIHLPKADKLQVIVFNLLGQKVSFFDQELEAGSHLFLFLPGTDQYYIFSAMVQGSYDAISMIHMDRSSQKICSLVYEGLIEPEDDQKFAPDRKNFAYSLGDTLRFIGFANTPLNVIGSGFIVDNPLENTNYQFEIANGIPCPESPTVTDVDGNVYKTVLIGNQCWMAESLKSTFYRNGVPIPNVPNNNSWQNLTTGAYVWFGNDIYYKDLYGALYNWYTIVDQNGLCPSGWRAPIQSDWTTLTNFIGGSSTQYGNRLKSCRQVNSPLGGDCNTSDHPRWNENNHYGTNDYGFSSLPGGYRYSNGIFDFIGKNGNWLSLSQASADEFWGRIISFNNGYFNANSYQKTFGFSVRCIKIPENVPNVNFSASPTSGECPLTVNFVDLSTNNPTSWLWDFGDGETSTQQNPVHTYYNPYNDRQYTVHLAASNQYGTNIEIKTNYIYVSSPGIYADFTANPTGGYAPLTVHFYSDWGGIGVSHFWNFGDGGTSGEQNPIHTYTWPGNFTVSLIVSNTCGESDTEIKYYYITVGGGAPIGGGFFILLILATVYGIKKYLKLKKISLL